MKEYDATEIAYKNGYKQGVQDILAEIDEILKNSIPGFFITIGLAELKKKYSGEKNG